MSSSFVLRKLILYVPVKFIPAILGVFLVFFLFGSFSAGQYVSYSVCITCALVSAQIFSGWIGNSLLYYFSGVSDKRGFVSDCVTTVLMVAPIAATVAAVVSNFFVEGDYVFACVWGLCFFQAIFFFAGTIFQAEYLVKVQFGAVLIQALTHLSVIYLTFGLLGVDFRFAILSLMAGYCFAALYLFFMVFLKYGLERPFSFSERFYANLKLKYDYGIALVPWMLGALVMSGVDRFAIDYYSVEHGDAYLSLKDLFVGAGGLLSMPVLMVVHSVVVDRFRSGSFDTKIIEGSVGLLVFMFASLWWVLYFVGFDFFERMTGKDVEVSGLAISLAFLGVSLACISVYLQKRLEVHKKLKYLAFFSLASASLSIILSFLGGQYYGLNGVALGGCAAQVTYFFLVSRSLLGKVSYSRCIGKPLLLSCLIFSWGYLCDAALSEWAPFMAWWLQSLSWLGGFLILFGLLFWKGVEWRAFFSK